MCGCRLSIATLDLKTRINPANYFAAMNNTLNRVFLSYSRADDEPFVERLYNDLTQTGFKVWRDRKSTLAHGGNSYQGGAGVWSL